MTKLQHATVELHAATFLRHGILKQKQYFNSTASSFKRLWWGSHLLVSKILVVLCVKIIGIGRFLTELFQQQKGGRFLRHSVYSVPSLYWPVSVVCVCCDKRWCLMIVLRCLALTTSVVSITSVFRIHCSDDKYCYGGVECILSTIRSLCFRVLLSTCLFIVKISMTSFDTSKWQRVKEWRFASTEDGKSPLP